MTKIFTTVLVVFSYLSWWDFILFFLFSFLCEFLSYSDILNLFLFNIFWGFILSNSMLHQLQVWFFLHSVQRKFFFCNHEIIHLKTCAKYFEKTNISYPSYAHYVCVSGCKKYWFFGKCFVRNKWMIPSFIYRVGNSCMLQFSNQSSIPIYPENISKTSGFLMFSGGVETEH